MEPFVRRFRALWAVRWRDIPVLALAGAVVLLGAAGAGTALAVTAGTPSENSVSTAASKQLAAEDARADTGGPDTGGPGSGGPASGGASASDQSGSGQVAADAAGKRIAPQQDAARRRASERKATRAERKATRAERKATGAGRKPAQADRKSRNWVLPLASYHLTGRFGQSGRRWSSFHHGLDFAAPSGTPIRAVGNGRIIAAGWAGAYGNHLEVRHSDGTVTWYAHMSRYARTSGKVKAGTVIGYVGATGNVTGPHLHLEVHPNGGGLSDAINPVNWLKRKGLNP
ncbi:M23 family metallopeptidase [Actinopolymorpha alba]|uniref:M23 family metallopeptidase n=1 Tax=Actinopolymorpha alba TaxID=533267 RepID=UPI00037E630B|nr:M23 family metallopeptidase [Actinopolymorpha alba]